MRALIIRNFKFVNRIFRNSNHFDISKYFSPPSLKIFLPIPGTNEIFHLHLFEFPRPENKISWSNLVAKCTSNLRYSEWEFGMKRIYYILEIYKNSAGRLWTQVCFLRFLPSPDFSFEH